MKNKKRERKRRKKREGVIIEHGDTFIWRTTGKTKPENKDALHSNNHDHKQQEQTSLTSIDAHTQTYLSRQHRDAQRKMVSWSARRFWSTGRKNKKKEAHSHSFLCARVPHEEGERRGRRREGLVDCTTQDKTRG